MQSSSKVDAVVVTAAAVLLCGLVARLAFLAADPTYPFWSGWVADEGRWARTARDIVLFGGPSLDSALARTHLILSPVYQAFATVVFWVFGVGPVQARLLSVAAGLGVLFVAARFLRHRLPARVTWVAVALLAVHPDLVYFSRVGIPEMPALFFEFCAFVLLVAGPRTRRTAFFGGVVTAIGLGVKGTSAPIVLGFAAVILLVHRPTDPAGRLARLTAFLAAIIVPAVVFVAGVSLRYTVLGGLQDILGFVDLDDAYGIMATLFQGGWTLRVNLLLTAVWGLGLVSWIRRCPESEARAIFIGSVVWISAWILPWALLLYFPERYVMHIHLPLVLALASGYAMASDARGAPLDEALGEITGLRRGVLAVLLALPAAVVTTPLVLSAVDVIGPMVENLRYQIAAIGAVSIILGWALLRRWRGSWVVGVALGYPLAAGILWAAGRATGWIGLPYWSIDGARTAGMWMLILIAAAAAAVAVARVGRARPGGSPRPREALYAGAFAAAIALLWTGQGVTKLGDRHYVMREVAAYLIEQYPETRLVGSQRASSLLLSTPFAHRALVPWEEWPDVVVSYWLDDGEERFDEYDLVREFDLSVGPGFIDTYREKHVIRIYERRR